jgi:GT2 family glycosyltransferase
VSAPATDPAALPRVVAVILNWNSGTDTIACLESLHRSSYPALRPLVVDNGSGDDSVAHIRARFPAVRLLALDANHGYAGGNNRGLAHALDECEFAWLLNPDVVVDGECLTRLVATAQAHPHAAMLGPLIRMREDRGRILSAGGQLVHGWARHRGMGELDHGQFREPAAVDFITGCALLVRRSTLAAVGMLDERFFLYAEEIDWCHRARAAGFTCLVEPSALAWHPNTIARDADSPLVTYYTARNQLLLIRKHRLGLALLARHLVRHARTLASWSLRPKWRHKSAQRRALWRALTDFARGRTGAATGDVFPPG